MITNMLALTVFMLIVADILPQTSEVVPLISVYFTSILIEVSSYMHSLIKISRFVSALHRCKVAVAYWLVPNG